MIFTGRAGGLPTAIAQGVVHLCILVALATLLCRIQARRATLEQSERHYRLIFDTLSVAILEHDFSAVAARIAQLRKGGVSDIRNHVGNHPEFVAAMRKLVKITDMNAAALAMLGVGSKAEFLARMCGFFSETDDSFSECIIAIGERRPMFQVETHVLPIHGPPRQVVVAFGLGPDISLDRVPGSLLDVSHRRALERQLLQKRDQLAHAERTGALAAMSAMIAHELNQPMAAIQSYADAARRWMSRNPPDLRETSLALAGIVEGVDHARTVMERVRALVGSSRIDLAEVELDGVLLTTVALMRCEAAETGTRLVMIPTTGDTLSVMGDRILLKQIFVNLITNAIHAMLNSPPEQRVVTLSLERRDDSALVTVADQGPGWDELDSGKEFDTFFTTKKNGTGLGLHICRTAVECHGGTLSRRNAEWGGAIVDISIPLSPFHQRTGPAADSVKDSHKSPFLFGV